MKGKAWLMGLTALLIFVGSAWGSERITVPLADAPVKGPATAPITLVEFLDFQ